MSSEQYKIIDDFGRYLESIPNIDYEESEVLIIPKLIELVSYIEKYQNSLDNKSKAVFKKKFQDQILPITNQSDLCHHCYKKPRGYAGDFMAMEKIWSGVANDNSQKYLGKNNVGKIINAFTLESPNCKANQYRIKYFKDIISKYNNANIASIGCGSTIEIEELFKTNKSLNNNIFYLLDQDQDALNCIKKKFPNSNNIRYISGNVLRKIIKFDKNIKFDLIYSSGMFDYLSLKQSKKVAYSLFDMLKIGGKMIITNAHPNNPSRFWMEYAMDWYLDYKNNQEMLQIPNLLLDKKRLSLELFTDEFGVYQYLHIQKIS